MNDKFILKINKPKILLTFIFAMMHNFFYLCPQKVGPINYFDIVFVFSMIIFAYSILKYRKKIFDGKFKKYIILVLALILSSSLAAFYNYNQPIIQGILTQRTWISTMLLYFVIYKMISNREITFDDIISILYKIVLFELIIYFLQFLVGSNHLFLSVNHNIRYESLRLYCNIDYFLIIYIISIESILKRKKIFINILFAIAILLYIFIVNKGRGAAMMFLISTCIVVVFCNTRKIYKILFGLLGLFLFVNFIWNLNVFQEFVNAVFRGEMDGTYNVRKLSQKFYISKWESSLFNFFFGYGYANSTNANSLIATGVTQGYHYADNGLYGFISCYGGVGLIWWILLIINRIKYGLLLKKQCILPLTAVLISLIFYATDVSYFYSYFSFELVVGLFIIDSLIIKKNKI